MMQECAALSTVYNVANAHGVRLVCRLATASREHVCGCILI